MEEDETSQASFTAPPAQESDDTTKTADKDGEISALEADASKEIEKTAGETEETDHKETDKSAKDSNALENSDQDKDGPTEKEKYEEAVKEVSNAGEKETPASTDVLEKEPSESQEVEKEERPVLDKEKCEDPEALKESGKNYKAKWNKLIT